MKIFILFSFFLNSVHKTESPLINFDNLCINMFGYISMKKNIKTSGEKVFDYSVKVQNNKLNKYTHLNLLTYI